MVNFQRLMDQEQLTVLDQKTAVSIVYWLEACLAFLNKEKATEVDEVKDQFYKASRSFTEVLKTARRLGLDQPQQQFGHNSDHAVASILIGIMNISKGNYENLSPIFRRLGAFPDKKSFDKMLEVLQKYKGAIKSREEIKAGYLASAKQKMSESEEGIKIDVNVGEQEDEEHRPSDEELFDKMDKDKSGFIELQEFKEIC